MKKLKAICLAAKTEYHFRCIMRLRRLGSSLLDAGESLSSERMLKLGDMISRHSIGVICTEGQYEKLLKTL